MAAFYCIPILLFILLGSNWSLHTPPSVVEVAFRAYDVIPDVVLKAPADYIKVEYGRVQVILGNILSTSQVQRAPAVWWPASPIKFYTLVCVDPDAYSRTNPNVSEVRHWVVGNIPGACVPHGDAVSPYRAPRYPPGSGGTHRMVFLVFEQIQKKTFVNLPNLNVTGDDIIRFSVREFAKQYDLGDPIAGNLFNMRLPSDIC